MPGSGLAWLAVEVAALFEHDERGRLLGWNVPGAEGSPVPRFFFGRTRTGNLWRFAADLPEERVRELARLAAAEPAARDLDAPAEREAALRALLEKDAPVEQVFCGPAFRFPDATAIAPGDGDRDAVALTPERAGLVAEGFPELHRTLAERQPCVAVLEAGRAVSVCYRATRPGRAADAPAVEAGVDTLPGFRGRGLATRAVEAWSRAVRERGQVPLYSTTFENRSARAVAERLGLIRFGTILHLR